MTSGELVPARSGFRTGQVAGNYRLLGLLGEGGMGEVYEAVHLAIDRKFAVKLLRPMHCSDGHMSSRFEREARVVGALECEQIVSVLDYGKLEDTTPYLVMERLQGDDLRSVLKLAGKLSLQRTLSLALDVCRGLEVAHRAGLVHRDLKPANLFLCRRPGGETLCKILDFGIVRQTDATTSALANVVGTARYMAPEQILSGGSVTPATDLYALGAIIYECLSGQRLHDGDGIEAVLFSVIHDAPKPLGELLPALPKQVCEIVQRLLRKRPGERFQSALELYGALIPLTAKGERDAGHLHGADFNDATLDAELEVTGGPVSFNAAPKSPGPWLRAAAGALLLSSVGAAGYWWGSSSAERAAAVPQDGGANEPTCPSPTPVTPESAPSTATLTSPALPPLSAQPQRMPSTSRVKPSSKPAAPAPQAGLFVGQSPYRSNGGKP